MSEKFVAHQAQDGLWGVEDEHGAILYEADMATEAQAQFIAKYHTDNPNAEFEQDVWPAWLEHLASTDPYESALLFVETASQDDLVNLIIEHHKLKAENIDLHQLCIQSYRELHPFTSEELKTKLKAVTVSVLVGN